MTATEKKIPTNRQRTNLIKKSLYQEFAIKFKGSSSAYSFNPEWSLGPSTHTVEDKLKRIEMGQFDGMKDSYDYKPKEERGIILDGYYIDGFKYVTGRREISNEFKFRLAKFVQKNLRFADLKPLWYIDDLYNESSFTVDGGLFRNHRSWGSYMRGVIGQMDFCTDDEAGIEFISIRQSDFSKSERGDFVLTYSHDGRVYETTSIMPLPDAKSQEILQEYIEQKNEEAADKIIELVEGVGDGSTIVSDVEIDLSDDTEDDELTEDEKRDLAIAFNRLLDKYDKGQEFEAALPVNPLLISDDVEGFEIQLNEQCEVERIAVVAKAKYDQEQRDRESAENPRREQFEKMFPRHVGNYRRLPVVKSCPRVIYEDNGFSIIAGIYGDEFRVYARNNATGDKYRALMNRNCLIADFEGFKVPWEVVAGASKVNWVIVKGLIENAG